MGKCITPFYKKETPTVPLPCGKCPPCCKRRASGWSFRLVKEGENFSLSYFVTLTYDTTHVPITPKGFMTLSRKPEHTENCRRKKNKKGICCNPSDDLQLFIKKVRKNSYVKIKNRKVYADIKYYACGEYGGLRSRPHYHVILFGADQATITRAWDKGQVYFGDVREASIGYTLKYISKERTVPIHANDDRRKEFSYMSKGIGKSYINARSIAWHIADLDKRMYLPLKDGKKAPMPRYYKQKVYNSEQAGWLKGVMEKLGKSQEEKILAKYSHQYIAESHIQSFKKMYKQAKDGTKL